MIKHIFFCMSILFTVLACKKDPEIGRKVLNLNAGDTFGPNIHYTNVNFNFNSWSLTDYYMSIDNADPCDFHISFYYDNPDPHAYEEGIAVNPISPDKSAYVYVDKAGYPIALHKGDRISDSLHWINTERNLDIYSIYYDYAPNGVRYSTGYWINNPNGYFAFKIVDKSLTYKGWIRIGLYNIYDYAYVVY